MVGLTERQSPLIPADDKYSQNPNHNFLCLHLAMRFCFDLHLLLHMQKAGLWQHYVLALRKESRVEYNR